MVAVSELPDWVINRIDADYDDQYMEPIAAVIFDDQNAWYTKNQIKYRLKENHDIEVSKPSITKKLDELQDLELVNNRKVGSTNIYYWNEDESDWPIPPDVVLQSRYTKLVQTLSTSYAWWGVVGVLGIFVGGILTVIGALGIANAVPLPIHPDSVIAVALLTLFCSYALLFMYLVAALVHISVDPDLPSFMQ